jgi:ribosomal protein S18 acetylase RimI-like enzyme
VTEIVEETIRRLRDHARISAAYEGKDYDAVEDPARWAETWDLSNWGLLAAYIDQVRIGGCVIAFDTPDFEMLDGPHTAVLWDLRVDPHHRRRGVATSLFAAAERWAGDRWCTLLRVETQDVNPAACRLYERCGCQLVRVRPGAYPTLPHETQLIWEKHIQGPRSHRSR